MPLALPDPYIGGDFAEDLTDVSDEEFRKKMKERFDSLQRNLDKLAKQFPLTAVSNLPQTPQARVTNTTGQSFGTGASTVPFNSTRWDLGTATAQFDDANNRLVCREAGLYVVYGHLAVDGTTFQLSLRVNGTTTIARSDGSYAGWFEGTSTTTSSCGSTTSPAAHARKPPRRTLRTCASWLGLGFHPKGPLWLNEDSSHTD
jgi:hypothetical protein